MDSLIHLKQMIIDNNYPDILESIFYEYNEENPCIKNRICDNKIWLHGKMYKKDFLTKYNINFKIDMSSNEDVFFSTYIKDYLLIDKEISTLRTDFNFYKWYNRKDSLCHSRDMNFTIFKESLEAYLEPCFSIIEKNPDAKSKILDDNIRVYTLMGYFYIQRIAYHNDLFLLEEAELYFEKQLKNILMTL
jgi:hypothetical protein